MDQTEFGEIAYEVMHCAFEVHEELGRVFDEPIYKRELAFHIPNSRTEIAIDVVFEDFKKTYYIDLLVGDGAIFELKAVDVLTPRHRGQLLNYLILTDAAYGKLINFRTDRVQHEFVNNNLNHAERTVFIIEDEYWRQMEARCFKERMIALLRDWSTGLDTALYEEAASHFFGRREEPCEDIDICVGQRHIGRQGVRVTEPDIGLRITAFSPEIVPAYEDHLRRFLEHTHLRGIQWINIAPGVVRFATVQRRG